MEVCNAVRYSQGQYRGSTFQVELPEDYKLLLPQINSAMTLSTFDIPGRKACVLDYMHNITDVLTASI